MTPSSVITMHEIEKCTFAHVKAAVRPNPPGLTTVFSAFTKIKAIDLFTAFGYNQM